MKKNLAENKWIVLLAFTAIYIVWGSTYLAIIFGLKGLPPFLMSSFRFLIAGAVLYGWCRWKGEQSPRIATLKSNAVIGTLLLMGGVVSVTWAEQYLPSSLAAIIVTAMPFWFVLLDKKQWNYYFSNKSILTGLIIGFVGVAILVSVRDSAYSGGGNTYQKSVGALVIMFGGIAWASGSLYSKYKSPQNSMLMNAAVQLLIGGFLALVVSLVVGEWNGFAFGKVSWQSWFALAYLVFMGSIVTYISYLWLLKVRPPAQVSTYVYVNPVVALLLGMVLADEKVSIWQVLALCIILFGVLLVNLPKYKNVIKFRLAGRNPRT